jgi:hypothetical protein
VGLDIVLGWPGQTKEQLTALMSEPVGDTVGYIRCAYDDGNFNKWARANLGGRDLYWIFNYNEDQLTRPEAADNPTPYFIPDWDACAERAQEALSLANEVEGNLFLVPFPPQTTKPEKLPREEDLLNIYRHSRQELSETWSGFNGATPPLKSAGGRFSAEWVKIQAVFWCQCLSYKPHSPPILDMRPVLVCEGPPEIRDHQIGLLNAVLSFINHGRDKRAWVYWSD